MVIQHMCVYLDPPVTPAMPRERQVVVAPPLDDFDEAPEVGPFYGPLPLPRLKKVRSNPRPKIGTPEWDGQFNNCFPGPESEEGLGQ